ncbi:uncharacterized protein LOC143577377 [Bidens hawaiensis]|uniref:uncharacterized protein LOC143577377 n=1 Tax=Bidens hawaiensis TaxID=980011 RepID=UPI0040499602
MELLDGNDTQCIELLRMSHDSFVRLCAHFKAKGWLKDNKHVTVEEKMATFLMVIGHNQCFIWMKRRFQHSKETIHKYFHEVLDKMMIFAEEVIRPTSFNPDPNIPGNNSKERRIFKGAVGALDGTLIHAIVPLDKQHLYRERVSIFFQDKYYLCDAAYKHTRGFMAPYRNACFPILKKMPPYPLVKQRDITIACFAIHNYIQKEGLSDELFFQYDQPQMPIDGDDDNGDDDDDELQSHGSNVDQQYMINMRDGIVTQLMRNRI